MLEKKTEYVSAAAFINDILLDISIKKGYKGDPNVIIWY